MFRYVVILSLAIAGSAGFVPSRVAAEDAAAVQSVAASRNLAVLETRTPQLLGTLQGGVRVWLLAILDAKGAHLVPAADVDTAIAANISEERPVFFGTDAPLLKAAVDADFVISSEIQYEAGDVTVWLRSFDAKNGQPATIGTAQGLLKDVGALLMEAARPILAAQGGGPIDEAAWTPRLGDLSGFARSWQHYRNGELAEAWQEIQTDKGETANWLRDRIVAFTKDPSVSVAARSRLASVRGVKDSDWLRVRHGIVKEDDADLLVAGAQNAVSRQDPARALELYDKAAQIDPSHPVAARGKARMQTKLGQHDAAKDSYGQLLQANPGDVEAHEALAGNPTLPDAQRAQHHLSAGKIRSQNFEAQSAGQQLQQAGALGILDQARANVALMNERMGNHGDALLTYEEIAASGNADVYTNLGLARTRGKAGNMSGASTAYQAALVAEPDNPEALLGQGRIMTSEGDPDAAVASLERAVEIDPGNAQARRALAAAHKAAGNTAAALDVLDPDAVDYDDRAGILADAAAIHEADGNTGQAELVLEEAVSLAPEDGPLRSSLARAYEANGNTDAAAMQQATVVALTGVQLRPSDEPAAADVEDGSRVMSGSQFGELIDDFPVVHPHRDRDIEVVAFLGIATPSGWEYQVRQWVMPKVLDAQALSDAMRGALSARYDVVPNMPVPDVASGAYGRILQMGKTRSDISLVNDLLDVHATFRARLTPKVEEGTSEIWGSPTRPIQLQVRMNGGRTDESVFIIQNGVHMPNPDAFVTWNPRAAVPGLILLALILYPVVRGWGSLEVNLEYEVSKNSKGFFSIQLSKKPGVAKRDSGKGAKSKSTKYQRKVRRWSRYARDMVGTKTMFRMIPSRSYYVVIHGLLQDRSSGEVIGNYLEERKVKVGRGGTTSVSFDFRVKQAPITVQLNRADSQTDKQALVAIKNAPETLRYVREESVILFAGNGRHTVVVGIDGAIFEVDLEIVDLTGLMVPLALGDNAQAIFHGCPDAVEPYVNGDYKTASKALDRAGYSELANTMRAEFHHERGEDEEAARFYEAAGNLTMAAELSANSQDAQHSATLFEQAGDFRRAAEGYAEAGDGIRAAQAFEAAYDYDNAIDAYREAGDLDKSMELLEKVGRFFEAGSTAFETGDKERAIRNLQMVDVRDPDFAQACHTLADLFAERGEWDLAIEKAREAANSAGDDHAALDVHERLGLLLEQAGRPGEALEIYENIRKRDYMYEGIGDRIAALREMVTTAAIDDAATQPAGAAMPASRPPADDRYEILDELGRGGMGVVYKAKDTRLGRVVALKQLPDNLKDHPTAVELFLREARAAAALNHQNIVTLFDADQTDDNYFITMEMLEGFPLDAVLKKRGKLKPKDAVRLMLQTAQGLQYAHDQRIVHRDIKTSNLFFTRDRIVKIMDFGLAKMLEEVRRATTVIGGTPYYMAPEQAAGEQLDHRADLYALGVTLFELLVGHVPFREGDVTFHHRHTEPPDVRDLVEGVPDVLADLVGDLMKKAPDDRPATTAEVVARLESILQSL